MDTQIGNADSLRAQLVGGHSIEVMPRTAARIPSFREILAPGTLIYIAHIEGTQLDDMIACAKRITDEGFAAMPHITARLICDDDALDTVLRRYAQEAGVSRALLLAGGIARPAGRYHCTMQLLESGIFDRFAYTHLHVAGHPEGNKDIDPDGGSRNTDEALRLKQAFSERTDARMALVTQFAFDSATITGWLQRIAASGIDLPVHVGIAGPTRLQTLLKFAISCGVGPSLRVLQRRARDISKLLQPFEPTDVLDGLARAGAAGQVPNMAGVHFFPLGGIKACAEWIASQTNN